MTDRRRSDRRKVRHESFILNEAIQEECIVVTNRETRTGLVLMDADQYFAMFRNNNVPGIVVIKMEDIHSLEFGGDEDEESQD